MPWDEAKNAYYRTSRNGKKGTRHDFAAGEMSQLAAALDAFYRRRKRKVALVQRAKSHIIVEQQRPVAANQTLDIASSKKLDEQERQLSERRNDGSTNPFLDIGEPSFEIIEEPLVERLPREQFEG